MADGAGGKSGSCLQWLVLLSACVVCVTMMLSGFCAAPRRFMPGEGTLLCLVVTAVGPAEQDTMANPGEIMEMHILALHWAASRLEIQQTVNVECKARISRVKDPPQLAPAPARLLQGLSLAESQPSQLLLCYSAVRAGATCGQVTHCPCRSAVRTTQGGCLCWQTLLSRL